MIYDPDQEVLGWAPRISLKDGIGRTYPWIREQVERSGGKPQEVLAP